MKTFGMVLLLGWVGGVSLFAQAENPTTAAPPLSAPSASAASPGTEASASSASSPTAASSDTASTALSYLFNKKPTDGSTMATANTVGGHVGDKLVAADALPVVGFPDPAMETRFETYLSLDPVSVENIQNYQATYAKSSDFLSQKDVFNAWKQLHVMGEQRALDAGIGTELANRIEAIWNNDEATLKIARTNDKLRDSIDSSSWNADMIASEVDRENVQKKSLGSGSSGSSNAGTTNSKSSSTNDPTAMSGGSGGGSDSSGGSYQSNLELTNEYLKTLEARAKIKLNEIKADKLSDQAKSDFASYIDTLFGSRRFQHVVLAADFYRTLFNEDNYPVSMANEVNASLQADKDIDSYVQAFVNKMQQGEVAGATVILQQAFASSEYHPALQSIDLSLKSKVRDYAQKLSVMQNLIEARDFGELETAIAAMKQLAPDFDATKVNAMVNGVKLDSQLHLGKAKLAAQQGNQQQALEEFQTAAQAWPGNPDLKAAANTFFNKEDAQNSSVAEFDRLYAGQDFRGIFDKQLMFAPAIAGDDKRIKQLTEALTKVKDAETASEKANMLLVNGDAYGAWEAVELETEAWPDDTKLNKLLAQLSVKSADFVRMLDQAKAARDANETGFSLTCYVNAQRMYPASQIANKAISELSAKLLSPATAIPEGSPKTAQN